MTCYFDARWIGEHGIGRFAAELARRLPVVPLPLAGSPSDPADPFRLATALGGVSRQDCFFSPGYNGPVWSRVPYIVTVHDLNHVDCEGNSSVLKKLYYRFILKRVCHRARAIFTVSEFSKSRIVEWMGVQEQKVFNVGNGVSEIFSGDVRPHDPGYAYIFCVSNRRPHKNEEGVVQGFAAAALPATVKLVFTGKPTPAIEQVCREVGVQDRVVFAGRLTEEQLAEHYRGALMLLFPSFYEGFGLPIIEAFASGTPVITSNVTSMPEIAADAALLVDPQKPQEIAQAIERLHGDAGLRQTLVVRGYERQKAYTWNAVAQRVEQAMRQVSML